MVAGTGQLPKSGRGGNFGTPEGLCAKCGAIRCGADLLAGVALLGTPDGAQRKVWRKTVRGSFAGRRGTFAGVALLALLMGLCAKCGAKRCGADLLAGVALLARLMGLNAKCGAVRCGAHLLAGVAFFALLRGSAQHVAPYGGAMGER